MNKEFEKTPTITMELDGDIYTIFMRNKVPKNEVFKNGKKADGSGPLPMEIYEAIGNKWAEIKSNKNIGY